MHNDAVADLEVVAKRELHVLERLEVLTTAPENMRCEQPAKLDTQPNILAANRRAIKGVPEPEQRLHALKSLLVTIAVVLRLERDVARIERRQRDTRGLRQALVRDRGIPLRGV